MVKSLNVTEFLEQSLGGVILDVRSPAEHLSGHIPQSNSFPLFTDEERAKVGTLYKQVGKEEAMIAGLEIVGPKMARMAAQAKQLAGRKPLFVHCWRGGMRSGSVAILLKTIGFQVYTLEGGYKAYRQQMIHDFLKPWKFAVLGGKTGSGKTAILKALLAMGEQVLDLEQIACHKGSAFGAIGEVSQPTSEQFANLLYDELRKMDINRTVWVEDESTMIGRVHIPSEIYLAYRKAPLYVIEVGEEWRVRYLIEQYGQTDKSEILACFGRIERKLGGQFLKEAIGYIHEGNAKAVVQIALRYYDRAYLYDLTRRENQSVIQLNVEGFSFSTIAQMLLSSRSASL
jgi:tRNA 2-selenouridine synthase